MAKITKTTSNNNLNQSKKFKIYIKKTTTSKTTTTTKPVPVVDVCTEHVDEAGPLRAPHGKLQLQQRFEIFCL